MKSTIKIEIVARHHMKYPISWSINWDTYNAGEVKLNTTHTQVDQIEALIKRCDAIGIKVIATLFDSNSIMALMQVSDIVDQAIDGNHNIDKILYMPYVPYGRQDKRSDHIGNECLSLQQFANIINILKFDKVEVVDQHSFMSSKLINNCESLLPNYPADWIKCIPSGQVVMVSPDASSKDRCEFVSFDHGLDASVIVCHKQRDPETGIITTLSLPEARQQAELIKDRNVIVVDDICDGGSTHIQAAKLVKAFEPCSMTLMVTHGFFTKGKDELNSVYDNVFALFDYSEDLE